MSQRRMPRARPHHATAQYDGEGRDRRGRNVDGCMRADRDRASYAYPSSVLFAGPDEVPAFRVLAGAMRLFEAI